MKTRIFRALVSVLLVCTLAFSMTGCEKLDYRRAIELYNAGKFEAAGELFDSLGEYEDCPALYTDCQYWVAATLAEQGNFEEALPRFAELGNYENSAQWVIECKYQMAVTAFSEGEFHQAENFFKETSDYKNTPEYMRQIRWFAFYDAVTNAGLNDGSGFSLKAQVDGKEIEIRANTYSQVLEFSVSEWKTDAFLFDDSLKITLTRDSTVASYEAGSGFGMDYLGDRIYSSQTATGKIDITTCTPETKLVMETFHKFVEDNKGETTESTDPADSLMNNAMAENLHDLLTIIPELLAENGITVTLQDIGFFAL